MSCRDEGIPSVIAWSGKNQYGSFVLQEFAGQFCGSQSGFFHEREWAGQVCDPLFDQLDFLSAKNGQIC